MNEREIIKILKQPMDHESVDAYMNMFDRILLYVLAVNAMPRGAIQNTIELWSKTVKKGIDLESKSRTEFLEETPEGRMAQIQDEPDGENLRLDKIKSWKMAEKIITANMLNHGKDDPDGDDPDNEWSAT